MSVPNDIESGIELAPYDMDGKVADFIGSVEGLLAFARREKALYDYFNRLTKHLTGRALGPDRMLCVPHGFAGASVVDRKEVAQLKSYGPVEGVPVPGDSSERRLVMLNQLLYSDDGINGQPISEITSLAIYTEDGYADAAESIAYGEHPEEFAEKVYDRDVLDMISGCTKHSSWKEFMETFTAADPERLEKEMTQQAGYSAWLLATGQAVGMPAQFTDFDSSTGLRSVPALN